MGALATRRDIAIVGIVGMLVGALLATVLAVSMPAEAADGDNLLIGRKNFANRVTTLKGRGGILFWNSTPKGEPAAWFEVVSGPPFAVNSSDRVDNLNADYLDDLSVEHIRPGWQGCGDGGDPDDWDCNGDLTVPTSGDLLLSGSVEVLADAGFADQVTCGFYVDGTWRVQSARRLDIAAGDYGVCASDLWVQGLTAGDHTVAFTVLGVAESTDVNQGSFWELFLPAGTVLPSP